jgi:hypothetical protein
VTGDDPFAALAEFGALLDELRATEVEAHVGRHLYSAQREVFLAREARLAVRASEISDRLDELTREP